MLVHNVRHVLGLTKVSFLNQSIIDVATVKGINTSNTNNTNNTNNTAPVGTEGGSVAASVADREIPLFDILFLDPEWGKYVYIGI